MLSKKSKLLAILLSALLFIATALMGATAAPKGVQIKKITVLNKGKSVKITFKKFKGAKSYQIRYGYKKNLKSAKVKKVKKTSVTLKKLKKGKTLYVKVRAKLKKGYTKFGAVKKIKLVVKQVATTVTTTPTTTLKTVPKTNSISQGDSLKSFCEGFELKILNPRENPEVGSPLYESRAFVEQMVEEQFNCTITQTGLSEGYLSAMSASLAAGNPQAHIYRVPDSSFAEYLKRGYFCDLTMALKYTKVDLTAAWYDSQSTEFFNINKKQYAWSPAFSDTYNIYYNKRLVQEQNLTEPRVLAEDGKWNWSEFNRYAKALGFVVQDNSSSLLLKGMVGSYGKSVTKIARGKAPTTNFEDGEVKICLATLNNWNKDGLVSWQDQDKFSSGQVAMIYGDENAVSHIIENQFNSEIGVVPFPKPTTQQKEYYSVKVENNPYFIPYTYEAEAMQILFLNNELNRQAHRFALRDFVTDNMQIFKGNELGMLRDLYGETENFETVNDWSALCEAGSPNLSNVTDDIVSGKFSATDAVNEYVDAIKENYSTTWKNNIITGDVG